jgi:hypothetical protein
MPRGCPSGLQLYDNRDVVKQAQTVSGPGRVVLRAIVRRLQGRPLWPHRITPPSI